ncbi:hypothetical protein HSX37_16350|uniref:Uncharacterized protein n=1 Tax=Dendrosporobacter quercicolus TaxID=146817 RepID=A0A1G9ZU18_9FIRM|nr:hypothetical protein [Dendrosporobacter quercicolus]NSL49608.1 hypothetical protein [Dendrosporobacter quercicolus DSM 1736]SDN24748.1 hypothetical protein SAMN04488502_11564 [Dendrosporobacter quercicolus]
MDNYPLEGSYPRVGLHIVLLTFQDGKHVGTIKRKLSSNCMGAKILQPIINEVEECPEEILDEHGGEITLTSPDGDTCVIDDPLLLVMSLVKVEIIAYEQRK